MARETKYAEVLIAANQRLKSGAMLSQIDELELSTAAWITARRQTMLHHSENGVPFEIYVDARSYVRLLDDLLGISYLSDAEKLRKLVFPSEFSRPLSSMRDLLVALRPIFVFVSLFSFEDNSRMMQNKVEQIGCLKEVL